MKKIIYLIFLITILLPSYTFASGTCLIKESTPDVLLEYIKNNRIIVRNITNSIIENKTPEQGKGLDGKWQDVKKDFSKASNEIFNDLNSLFSFSGYESYFKYYVTYPIFNEVPNEVIRDYKLLNSEYEGLMSYIQTIDKKGDGEKKISEICKGVDNNCDFEDMKASKIVGKLIKNNYNILDYLRLTIIGEITELNSEEFFLIDNNFDLDINKYYGKQAVADCNSDEGFFSQIMESIEGIVELTKDGKDGIKEWQDAWNMLVGAAPDSEIRQKERDLLKDYLKEQGVSADNQAIMLDNLDKYNQEGLSLNNNFITNTITSTFSKVKKEMNKWVKKVASDFFNNDVVLDELSKATDNSKLSIEIKNNISELYNNELPYAGVGDITTEKLRSKIIQSHITINQGIKKLEETIKISQKVCKSQDKGSGTCD